MLPRVGSPVGHCGGTYPRKRRESSQDAGARPERAPAPRRVTTVPSRCPTASHPTTSPSSSTTARSARRCAGTRARSRRRAAARRTSRRRRWIGSTSCACGRGAVDARDRPIRCGRAPAAATARCTATTATSPGSCCSPAAPPRSRAASGHPALAGYSERFRARERAARPRSSLRCSARAARRARAEIGFWPGCDAIDKGAGDIAAALAVFERDGIEHVKLVDAPQACAGYPLLAAGHRDLFRWHAGRVAASLRGFRNVVDQLLGVPLHAARAVPGRGRDAARRGRLARRVAGAGARATSPCPLNRSARSTTTTPATTRATTASSSSRAARWRSSPRSASSSWSKHRHRVLRRRRPAAQDHAARRRSDGASAGSPRSHAQRRRHGRHLVRDLHVHAQAQRAAVGRGRQPARPRWRSSPRRRSRRRPPASTTKHEPQPRPRAFRGDETVIDAYCRGSAFARGVARHACIAGSAAIAST